MSCKNCNSGNITKYVNLSEMPELPFADADRLLAIDDDGRPLVVTAPTNVDTSVVEEQIRVVNEKLDIEINEREVADNVLSNNINNVNIRIDGLEGDIEFLETDIDNKLNLKADKSDTYTKTEVDNLIPNTSNLATKTELNDGLSLKADLTYVNDELDLKADKSEIPDVSNLVTETEFNNELSLKADKSDTYTKTEVNNLIPDTSNLATKTELNDGLNSKQDTLVSNVNIKTVNGQSVLGTGNIEIDVDGGTMIHNELNGRDALDAHPITAITGLSSELDNINDELALKADKSDTYTKTEVDGLIPNTSNLATKTELNDGLNTKADLSYVNDELALKADKSEIPDVSDFITETELNDELSLKADLTYVNTELSLKANKSEIPDISNLVTETELNDALSLKANKSEIPDVSDFITETEFNNGLNLKADKSNTYTKSEVDNLIPDTSNLATKAEVNLKADLTYVNSELSLKADKTEIPDVSNLATKTELNTKADLTYVNDELIYVNDELSLKADKTEIPDVSNLATKAELATKQNDLTSVSDIVIVSELPSTPDPSIMYLIEIE